MFNLKKFIYLIALASISFSAVADTYGPAFDKDVESFSAAFSGGNEKALDEALIRLQWAGITDPRIFDPLVEKIKQNNKKPKILATYVQALTYSGSPQYRVFLEQLSLDRAQSSSVRDEAKNGLMLVNKYQQIAEYMATDTEKATTYKELWATRYKNGLAVDDRVRMRWAARDLYLFPLGVEGFDVAKKTLEANIYNTIDDDYKIDAFAFLCKALGLSRNADYKDVLVQLANNSPNKKLAEYAERSTQYLDPTFKMKNKVIKKK
jgi:hypothetical protein